MGQLPKRKNKKDKRRNKSRWSKVRDKGLARARAERHAGGTDEAIEKGWITFNNDHGDVD
jgi:hypothetical protein